MRLLLSHQINFCIFMSLSGIINTMDNDLRIVCNSKQTNFNNAAFNAHGTMVIVATADALNFFNSETGTRIKSIPCTANHHKVVLINDTTLIGVGPHHTMVYDLSNDTSRDLEYPSYQIKFNYNGSKVILIDAYTHPILWDMKENKIAELKTTHTHGMQQIALSPNEKYIAIGSRGDGNLKSIEIWSTENQTLVTALGQPCDVLKLAFTHDSEHILISSAPAFVSDTDFVVRNIETGNIIYHLNSIQEGLVYNIFPSAKNNLIASLNNNFIYIWDSSSLAAPIKIIETNASFGSNMDLIFSHDNSMIAIQLEKTEKAPQSLDPAGRIGIITDLGGYCSNSIMIYDITTGKMLEHITEDVAQSWFAMTFSRDDKKLLSFTKSKNGDTYYYAPTIWNLKK